MKNSKVAVFGGLGAMAFSFIAAVIALCLVVSPAMAQLPPDPAPTPSVDDILNDIITELDPPWPVPPPVPLPPPGMNDVEFWVWIWLIDHGYL